MKSLIIGLFCLSLFGADATAQEKKNKIIRFNNITEVAVGFQLGKTTRVTSFSGGESSLNVAGRKFPAPRLASSFGILLGDIFFIGPGLSYTFQSEDGNNQQEHQVSVFGQTRLNFARGRIRPFIDFKGGYHFASFEELDQTLDSDWYKWDGFSLEPALGISFKLGGHALLNVSLGYQFVSAGNRIEQSILDDNGNPLIDAALNEQYHRFILSVGFTFQ
jgi:hypothetical protein